MGIAVGIDLGTTNTVVAAVRDGVATTLADVDGNKLIPSVVAFHPNGTVQVGWPALERRIIDPENTVYSVKRLIGRSFQSPEVQSQKQRFPFKVVEGPKSATHVETRAETYALPEISAFVLRRAKAVAEAALGESVDAAVITVPANFDDPQRASTKMAGKLAGLEVLRILNEPTAAALAYGRAPDKSERLCVYDLGGGTFDVTLLDVASGVFEVLSTAGDTALGGDDIDAIIVDRMANMAMRSLNVDPRNNPNAVARMRVAAEALKKELSFRAEASVEVTDIGRGEEGIPLTLKCRMSREDLERLAAPIVDRTLEVTRRAMANAKIEYGAFDRVILVGGSTRMPMVVRQVQELFQKKTEQRINPDEVVALGAAIQAHSLGARKGRGKKPPPTLAEAAGRTMAGVAPAPPRLLSGQHAIPAELKGALGPQVTRPGIAPPVTKLGGGPVQAPAAGPSGAVTPAFGTDAVPAEMRAALEASAKGVVEAEAKETRKSDYTGLKTRKAGDVREITTVKRYDPRAEPEDDDEITGQYPSAPPAPTTKKLPDLPPTRPGMKAIDPAAAAAAAEADRKKKEAQKPLPPREVSFTRGAPQLHWSSVPPALGQPGGDSEELDLPRPPAVARGTDAPRITPEPPEPPEFELPPPLPRGPTPVPALPGDHGSGVSPKPVPKPPPPAAAASALLHQEIDEKLQPDEALLIDVTPLSLRVETVGGYCDTLIAANSQVPCDRTRVFSTAADGQTQVFIRVAQGERQMFKENTFLGELELSGLVPLPRGEAQIAVTFEIDADGILAVHAKDGRTGKETRAKMHVFGAQTEEGDLQQMMSRQNQRKVV
jgi:molecular chaperone DnaK